MSGDEGLSRDALCARLLERIHAVRVEHPVRVAIDGPDAAGKTMLADELADVMRAAGIEVIRASVDGFHRSRAERYARGQNSPEGYYRDSFDHDALLENLLDPLGPGGSRIYRVACFDLEANEPLGAEPALAANDAVLLFDGVFLLRPELRAAWDFSVFVATEFDVILDRARTRDVPSLGTPEAVEQRYRDRYIPGQQIYFAEAQPQRIADAVVTNDHPFAPRLRCTRA